MLVRTYYSVTDTYHNHTETRIAGVEASPQLESETPYYKHSELILPRLPLDVNSCIIDMVGHGKMHLLQSRIKFLMGLKNI